MTNIEKTLIRVLAGQDATRIAIFGSRAKGEEHPGSDLDILVTFGKPKSLLRIVSIEQDLSVRLGIPVDLVTEAAISPHLRATILAQQKVIYP